MKTFTTYIISCLSSLLLVATLSSVTLTAQSGFRTDAIQYESLQMRTRAGVLSVSCQIVIPQDATPRGKALLIQPVYKTAQAEEILLPHLILNGKWQAPYYEREVALQSHEEYMNTRPYGVATLSGKHDAEPLTINYEITQALPKGATGALEMRYYGMDCCDTDPLGLLALTPAKPDRITITEDNLSPFLAAQDEPTKRRQEEIELRINYRFDRSEVLPNYRQNNEQLTELSNTLAPILNDPTSYKVVLGSITGYASPEGPELHNKGLSERRAQSIKQYLIKQYSEQLFGGLQVIGAGADWTGLREVIARSTGRADQKDVLAVLDAGYTPERRQEELAKLSTYGDLLRNVYPPLRRSTLRLEYEVRAFSLEESIEIMKTRPKDLSVSELNRIAAAYEQQGRNADEVYRIAATCNPTNVGAQLNYSRLLLLEGKLSEAWQILQPLQAEPAAYNNIGVYYMLSGNEQLAGQYLRQALTTRDAAVARHNLETFAL
ncbi:hypothetical protein [Porphyromonas uenonis]|uniref:hypothetical protein n=1 Tax=Porphyromonas uenonis TaxID=281920 RepID=UPI0026F27AEE|nr:hypothetical protein [Porphyromonas uenonis]